jgi:hypothetical protein
MPSILRTLGLVGAVVLLFSAAGAGIVRAQQDTAIHTDFNFGRILQGTPVEHQFVVTNERTVPLVVDAVRLTPPLALVKAPTTLAPGTEGIVRVRLDTSRVLGLFEGRIVISPDSSGDPIALTLTGTVYQTVEAVPQPALFVMTERGQMREQSIELVNHEPTPLEIRSVSHPRDRFATRIEPIEPGRRYRLTLTLDGTGAGGRTTDPIIVTTSSQSTPIITILANTFVRERVYTFPDAVDFGTLPLGAVEANPALLARFAQTLMIYRKEPDFEVAMTSDVDLLDVRASRGPRGDRWQATVSLSRDMLRPGPFRGTIIITTNDAEFPRLTVPVTGLLQR